MRKIKFSKGTACIPHSIRELIAVIIGTILPNLLVLGVLEDHLLGSLTESLRIVVKPTQLRFLGTVDWDRGQLARTFWRKQPMVRRQQIVSMHLDDEISSFVCIRQEQGSQSSLMPPLTNSHAILGRVMNGVPCGTPCSTYSTPIVQ